MDEIDRKLLALLPEVTRPSMVELARRAGVARGTAQARIDRLIETGVIDGFGAKLHLDGLGYVVTAFVSMEISQGSGSNIVSALENIPEVLEVHKATGSGDLLVRVVARSNAHLHDLIESLLAHDGVMRTQTTLILHTAVQRGPDSVLTGPRKGTKPAR
jgi:DNA-binding Lrp family transcriptional regulator